MTDSSRFAPLAQQDALTVDCVESAEQVRVAIVTGGGSGIGQATCGTLASKGYCLVVVGRGSANVEDTLDSLPGGKTRHTGLVLDVTDPSAMEDMAGETLRRYGRIDLLVASAGIGQTGISQSRLPYSAADLPLAEWRGVLEVNLLGAFHACRAVLPTMLKQGKGDLVLVGSSTTPHGLRGQPFALPYCASKFALVGLVEALSLELEDTGVRVQLVCPGAVETPLVANTILARPFGGAIQSNHLGEMIEKLINMPGDLSLVNPLFIPFFTAQV